MPIINGKRNIMCNSCIFLCKDNKKDILESGHYCYECNKCENGRTVGYMKSDSELKTMGCSEYNRLKFGDCFCLNKRYQVFYLGVIKGKRLLYNLDLKVYKLVKDNWATGKDIKMIRRYGKHKMCIQYRSDYIKQCRNK